jgi:hypothetical protein
MAAIEMMNFRIIALVFGVLNIMGSRVSAQSASNGIDQQFAAYTNTLHEKLFTHTDKNAYLPGEIIWFTVYALEASTNHRLDMSKVAYVEIIDSENRPLLQAKIELKKGIGAGSFYLPVSFKSGNYTFRAYTNWMKNFSPELFFHKTISVYNTYQEEKNVGTRQEVGAQIQFFPEGGNLVSGLESKVAFRFIDRNGKGSNFEGVLINQRNDTIMRFRPHKFGIGSFTFVPDKRATYRAVIKPQKDKTFTAALPEIQSSGYVMGFDTHNSLLRVSSTSLADDSLYVFIHSGYKVIRNQALAIKRGVAELQLPKEAFLEGVSHITIFDKQKNPLCERLYFKKPSRMLEIAVTQTKQEYAKREPISLEISNTNELNHSVAANFSTSVYLSDSLDSQSEDIATYAWLTSDLTGKVENPDFYLNTGDEVATDNLMLSHGWRRFLWKDLTSFESDFIHLPELDGHIVSAKFLNSAPQELPGTTIAYLSVPDKTLHFYTASSRKYGEFKFFTKNFYGTKELVLQTDPRLSSLMKFEILSPFSDKVTTDSSSKFNFNKGIQQTLLKRSISTQVTNVFLGRFLKNELLVQQDSTPFYNKADKSYKLDDYVRFPTMEEVLREYVSEVSVDIKKKAYHLKILDPELKQFYTSPPLILVDGVPVFDDGDKIIKYDPLKIERLNVVNTTFFYGPTVFKGIASFKTYKGDFAGSEMNPLATVADYEGLQLQREFYSPMHNGDKSDIRIPDFRNTLYWAPNVSTSKDGKATLNFYSSDLSGRYKVVIQGVSDGGRLGYKTLEFNVKE